MSTSRADQQPLTGQPKPAISAGAQCLKFFVVGGNILFLLLGAVAIGLASYSLIHNDHKSVSQLIPFTIPVGLIVLGVFTVLLSCFGCCGAWKESRGLLGLYFVILLILVIAQVGVGVGAVVYGNKLNDVLANAWASEEADNVRPEIQTEFNCCGWTDPSDHPSIPCPDNASVGCIEAITGAIKDKLKIVEIVGITIGSIEILGLLLSCCLFCKLPSADDKKQAMLEQAYQANRQYY
eukprot:TRINITY_DN103_c0_g1_i5.p2 TRINITY_DN103_c0_g1~~TRINITY_DN103_c0_g1_i5.p2  ORF type:complete len:237 (-),score=44.84 TRINITY_DN103_c0_g1_i5:1113-1823(-)